MSGREAILRNLNRVRRENVVEDVWSTRRNFDDPFERFATSVVGLKGEILRAESLDAALDQLGGLLKDIGAEQVVANDESPLSEVDLAARYEDSNWHVVGRSDGDLRAFCAVADAGVSGVSAALVETGSLVVESGPGKSRLSTLLPPVHVALVPESKLTTDLHTWTAARSGDIATNVTVISGPSKTADIEFTLTLGAHGPKRLVVILYRD
jgi:L-lactate dehydrogenase complex protein LldG